MRLPIFTGRILGYLVFATLSISIEIDSSSAEKPEVMILLDASSSMERLQNGTGFPSGCEWPRGGLDPQVLGAAGFTAQGGQQQDFDNLSRMQWVQWHIAGSIKGPLKCIGHDANERETKHFMGRDGFIAHYRLMCGSQMINNLGILPGGYAPCGDDHGRIKSNALFKDPDSDDGNPNYPNAGDGFIHSGGVNIQFGLMVSDSDPESYTAIGAGPTSPEVIHWQSFLMTSK